MRPFGRKAQRLAISMRVVERLGEVGEHLRHRVGALEVVLARDAAAVVLDHVAPAGDAQQRIVRLVVVGAGEVGFVGGDDGDVLARRRA